MFLSLRWIYARLTSQVVQTRDGNRLSTIPFLLVLSTLLLIGLHGFSVIKMAIIFALNYTIAKYCKGSRMGPLLTWLFNAAVLFANEYKEGYHFADIHSSLESWVRTLLTNVSNRSQKHGNRIASRVFIRDGMLFSTSRCFDWSPSIWITIGHITVQGPQTYAYDPNSGLEINIDHHFTFRQIKCLITSIV